MLAANMLKIPKSLDLIELIFFQSLLPNRSLDNIDSTLTTRQ